MFRLIWAARWYMLLGLLTFLIVLAVNTPLHFVWGFVEPQIRGLPVNIRNVSGTLWQGNARVSVPQLRSLGEMDAQWQLSPLSLLTGTADVALHLKGTGIRLTAVSQVGMNKQIEIERADGFLDSSVIQPLLKPNRIDLAGNFELAQITGSMNLADHSFEGLSGRLVYSGGRVTVPVNNKPVQATMPMVLGTISMDGDKAVINATTTEGGQLLQAYMQPDGWGGVAVRRLFLDVLGQQWPNKAEEDTVIFEVSHKIL